MQAAQMLYGLKQAPRAWYQTFSAALTAAGFVVSDADPSLFILIKGDGDITYLLLYVDDILLFSQKMDNINTSKSLLVVKTLHLQGNFY